MERFAFIIHPLSAKDVARQYPVAKYLPDRLVEWAITHKDPFVVSHITGIRAADGTEAEGWFIGCPLTPRQLLSLPEEEVWKRLVIAAHGNSLRALVKYFDNVSEKDILELNIPTGIPLVYEFDGDLKATHHYYLGDADAIAKAQAAVANQGKSK